MNNRAQYTALRCSIQASRADNNADRYRINDQLQVKEDFHEFIPCELKDESMMKREPNRDRPLIDVTEEYLKKFSDYEKHPSYSITALIEEIEDTINPIHK